MRRVAWLATACISLFLPLAAQAQSGFVTADVNLRAGPDVGYPAVTMLPAGVGVSIQGCIDGWAWCDVIAGPDRGWVAGTFLQETYDGRRVYVADYGARIGIPIVAFALGAYWDHNYRARSWYHQRSSWEHRSFSHRAPPRPAYYGNHGSHYGNHGSHGYVHAPAQMNGAHGNRVVHETRVVRTAHTTGVVHTSHAAPMRGHGSNVHAASMHNHGGNVHAAPMHNSHAGNVHAKSVHAPSHHGAPAKGHDDDHHH